MCCPTVNFIYKRRLFHVLLVSDSLLLGVSVSAEEYRSIGLYWEMFERLGSWGCALQVCMDGSRWQPLEPVQADIFPTGQFQHHHSGPLAEEQCDRWKHRTLCNEIDLTGSVCLAGMQVDNIVPADKKDVYLLPVSKRQPLQVSFQIDTAVLEFRSLLVVVLMCLVPRVTPSAPCRRARIAPGGSH